MDILLEFGQYIRFLKEVFSVDRILVPLDGSLLAESALAHAKKLYSAPEATIFLLRIVPDLPIVPILGDPTIGGISIGAGSLGEAVNESIENMIAEARKYLGKEAWKLQWDEVPVLWEVRQGSPADEIARYAEENSIDMIIMASKRVSGLTKFIIGSVTDKVLSATTIPVLVIKVTGS